MSLTHTLNEAADQIGVSYDWLRRAARAGKVPHRRFGRLVKFTDDDIAAIIHNASTATEPAAASGLSSRSASRLARAS